MDIQRLELQAMRRRTALCFYCFRKTKKVTRFALIMAVEEVKNIELSNFTFKQKLKYLFDLEPVSKKIMSA